jgi:hypothetical protein
VSLVAVKDDGSLERAKERTVLCLQEPRSRMARDQIPSQDRWGWWVTDSERKSPKKKEEVGTHKDLGLKKGNRATLHSRWPY